MGPESSSHKVTLIPTGGALEVLAGVGRQIVSKARSHGSFESNRLSEHLSYILAGSLLRPGTEVAGSGRTGIQKCTQSEFEDGDGSVTLRHHAARRRLGH
jgi:hypothetical protein